jgi:hypothetical protein
MVTSDPTAAPLVPPHVARDHPIVTRDYSLYTLAIHEMAQSIAGWLDDQADGATIFGPSRYGKSSAVDHWLQKLLSERHGGYVPMVVWSHIDSGGAQSVGRFYANLLDASAHPLAKAVRSPLDRQHMLIERWMAMAAQGGGRFVVLVIDEAQSMTQREWIWLVELHSTLQKQRIRLCVFSVTSLQFFDEPIGMALSGGAHVAARFMLAARPFHGVRSVQELAYVMAGYDSGTAWPPGSGVSFTAGLAAQAWSEGFRIKPSAGADESHDRGAAATLRRTDRLSDEDRGPGEPTSGSVALPVDKCVSGRSRCQLLKRDGFVLPMHKIGRQKTAHCRPPS